MQFDAARSFESLEPRCFLSTTLLSTTPAAAAGNARSGALADFGPFAPSLSADGRFVAFVSEASDLVASDANAAPDVFVRDTQTGVITLVSVATTGVAGNSGSGVSSFITNTGPRISDDGRFVVFVSDASDLVAGDGNGSSDIFIRDLQTGTTTLVSHVAGGNGSAGDGSTFCAQPVISGDGRFVAYTSSAGDLITAGSPAAANTGVFVYDTQTATNQLVSVASPDAAGGSAGGDSNSPSISGDGRFVAFVSQASNLVAGMPAGTVGNIFVRDVQSQTTVLISSAAGSGGGGGDADSLSPILSNDGSTVAFRSLATNLVQGVTIPTGGVGDGNIYLRPTSAASGTRLVSADVGTGGPANGSCYDPVISDDGRFVAFSSFATNLVTGVLDDNAALDTFVWDATTGTATAASVSVTGTSTGDFGSGDLNQAPSISGDGRLVGFISSATNLVAGDTNAQPDAFVRDRGTARTKLMGADSMVTAGQAFALTVDRSGATAAVVTAAALSAADANGLEDVYADAASDGGTPAADLTVSLDGSVLPTSAVTGQKVKAKPVAIVTNVGQTLASGRVTVDLFMSNDQVLDGADVAAGSVVKKLKLKPTQGKRLKVKLSTFPTVATDGSYFLLARVSTDASIPEAILSNNTAALATPVALAAPFVNLSGAFVAEPETITPGKKTSMLVQVNNLGNVIASGRTDVVITATLPAGAGSLPLATVPVKLKIKPGTSKVLKLKVLVPADLAIGSITLGGVVNATNAIGESDLADNGFAGATSVMVVA